MNERDLDRFNAVNCKRLECHYKTRRHDGFCSDRCLTAVRSAGDGTHGYSRPTSIPFPAFSDPTVPDARTASRGGVIFGQVQASPAAVPAP